LVVLLDAFRDDTHARCAAKGDDCFDKRIVVHEVVQMPGGFVDAGDVGKRGDDLEDLASRLLDHTYALPGREGLATASLHALGMDMTRVTMKPCESGTRMRCRSHLAFDNGGG
jgi:hypothetical protein